MYEKQKDLVKGYNSFTDIDTKHANMLMDVGVFVFDGNETEEFLFEDKECVFLLLSGSVEIICEDKNISISRKNVFEEKPFCLHVCKNTKVIIKANKKAEVLLQKAINEKEFEKVFYMPEDIEDKFLGDKEFSKTSMRLIRDIFNYDNAPYSNMVIGEIITFPGRWSSYPPHWHRQPEVYYYKFDKPTGFGCSIIDDNVYKIEDNSISVIPGGLCHPQVSGPGYAMYYTWMIRHLENDPWNERIYDENHMWLLEEEPDIWGE